MLFTCKKMYVLQFYVEKQIFSEENGGNGGGNGALLLSPFSLRP